MKFPRVRIWTLMGLVAVSAVSIVAPGEYRNRLECSKLEKKKSESLDRAELSERERACCLERVGLEPYNSTRRSEYLNEHGFWKGFCHQGYFQDWNAEADWHAQMVKDCREGVIWYETEINQVRKRLLIPWI